MALPDACCVLAEVLPPADLLTYATLSIAIPPIPAPMGRLPNDPAVPTPVTACLLHAVSPNTCRGTLGATRTRLAWPLQWQARHTCSRRSPYLQVGVGGCHTFSLPGKRTPDKEPFASNPCAVHSPHYPSQHCCSFAWQPVCLCGARTCYS